MKPAESRLLRAALRNRSCSELRRLFAAVRAHDDAALLAVLHPDAKETRPHGDPLVHELARVMRPIIARSAEKADLLVEHMAQRRRRRLEFQPRGLADAARRLRATFTDEQILEDAKSLVARLAAAHDGDTVV